MSPRCPYCLDDLLPDHNTIRCTSCRTPHHKDCFDENQGCVSYGCMGLEDEKAGLSIFAKAAIKISHRASRHVELGPFMFGFKRLPPVPERRPSWRCPQPYARLGFESREVREGELVRGKGVIYVPSKTHFKRIELTILQGIGHPQELETVFLTDEEGRLFGSSPHLDSGSHPFYLQFRAPETTPPVDPFLLELVLAQSMFKEIRSTRLPLFLLQRQVQTRRREDPPPIPIRIQRSRQQDLDEAARPEAGRPDPVAPWNAPPGPMAPPLPAAQEPILLPNPAVQEPILLPNPAVPASQPVNPFLRPPEAEPAIDPFRRPSDNPFARLPVHEVPSEGRPATVRLAPIEVPEEWIHVPLRKLDGTETEGGLPIRLIPVPGEAPTEIMLTAPNAPNTTEFSLTVYGGGRFRSLSLAIHSELVRPGGGEVEWSGFPHLVEAPLLGTSGLEPDRYGQGAGVQARLQVPSDDLNALAKVRTEVAHNAALRLRLAVDGVDITGLRIHGPTRTVTLITT